MTRPIKWTEEVIQFMIDNYKDKDNIQLANLLNEKFNLNTNGDRVSSIKSNLQRRRGINLRTYINNGGFKKGRIPSNKGKKMSKEQYAICSKTMFKKGDKPKNTKPIGSERISVDGFVEIKVGEPDRWRLKARWLYEKYYKVKLSRNEIVIYLDGNKENLDINNLKKITRAENLIMNKNKLRYENKEATETGILIAKLMDKVKTR